MSGGWRRPADQPEFRLARRWAYPPEPWTLPGEPFDGETVLRDLEEVAEPAEVGRIVARFAALRFLMIATSPRMPLRSLTQERGLAVPYTSALRTPAVEARALRAVVALARYSPPRRLIVFVDDAARSAARSHHGWGAFALQRQAYALSVRRGWHAEAARAAHAIAKLAEAGGGDVSVRLWTRRAHVLARRAAAES